MSALRTLAALLLTALCLHAVEVLGAVKVVDQPLDKPVCAVWAPNDPTRMFVIEQHAGRIRIVKDGVLQAAPFLTVPGVATHQEQGLLSLVFDPDYPANGHFYVEYSDAAGDNVISRFTRSGTDSADAASERVILKLDHPDGSDVHYGSFLGFNPKDLGDAAKRHWLYITVGDGGGGNHLSAQNIQTLFGKFLRIDVDPARYVGAGKPAYGIPSGSTPIAAGAKPEIIAMGVRNPWRASFDRATGDLWFGDVGDTTFEEINRLPYGATGCNFQWPAKEGSKLHNNPPATIGVITEPVHFFDRGAVIGGVVYRGNALPGWRGSYLFADYGSNSIRSFTFADPGITGLRTDLGTEIGAKVQYGLSRMVAFGEDLDGELYLCEHMRSASSASGMVYRIRQDTDQTPPTVTSSPILRATTGFPYAYTVTATGNPTPTFSLTTAPAGMSIDSASGLISWTPTEAQIGSQSITVRAANGVLPNAPQSFQVVVSGQRPADHATGTTALAGGLEYGYYEGSWPDLPAFAALAATRRGTAANADLTQAHRATDYAFRFTGFVHAARAGLYSFSTTSDDGSMLYIGHDTIVDNHGAHGSTTVTGTIGLAQGWHRITVDYHQIGGGANLEVKWSIPTDAGPSAQTAIPAASLGRLASPYGLDGYPGSTPYFAMPRLATGAMPATLSATGVFADTPAMRPAAGLITYDVNTPLWSDGAGKQRWLAVPTGSRIGFSADGNWVFPAGSVLVKHFDLGAKRLETRLLVIMDNGSSYGVTYKWRADNSDADLLPGDAPLSETVGSQTWTYPSRANCMQCHTQVAGYVLGARTRQFNRSYTYPSTGRSDNQLRTLGGLGLFDSAYSEAALASYVRTVAVGDTTATLEQRARSYLDANCMMCHQPGGGAVAQFDARYSTPLAQQGLIDGALNNTLGIAGAKVVVGGDPARSMLHVRMNTNDPAIRMPALGRSVIDQTAQDTVAQWIRSLPGNGPVNAAPRVQMGPAPAATSGVATSLSATVTDDGLPSGASVTVAWSQVSGPGAVVFAQGASATSGVIFPVAGTYVLRLTANDTQLGASAELTVVAAPPSSGTQVVAAIDCGSATATTAADGTVYQADTGYTASATSGRGDPVTGTTDQKLYQTERYGTFSYRIPVPAPGTYDVVLQMSEVWFTAPGKRLFDVSAQGQTVIAGIDIFAATGARYAAYNRRISVAVTGTTLDLGFITRADNALISAIRVERAGAANAAPRITLGAAPTPTAGIASSVSATVVDDGLPSGAAVTTVWSQVSGPGSAVFATAASTTSGVTFPVAGTYVLRLTASDTSLTASADLTVTVAPPTPSGGQVVVAIDCGSTTATTAADGTVYQADAWFTPSATSGRGDPVAGTADQALYQTERFGTFSYRIPVPSAGTYDVVIQMCEVWWTQAGARLFDVQAQNQPVLTGIDIYAAVGARYKAYDRRVTVAVSGTTLDLDFITRGDNALVSAIRIERAGTPPPINTAPRIVLAAAPSATAAVATTVSASVADDGLPNGAAATVAWSQISGPGATVLATAASATSGVTFPLAGTYVLRLTASDGQLTTTADLTVTVDAAASQPPILVDFVPAGTAPQTGWLADTGTLFADRGNGQSYGWSVANPDTRKRGAANSPDAMHDTTIHMAKGTVKSWEIAVPNGLYQVDISAGDPSYTDSINHLSIEGTAVRDPDGNDNFDESSVTVTVSDGRLTIAQAADGQNAKLCGARIAKVPTGSN